MRALWNAALPLAVGTRNIQRKLGHVPRERGTKKKNTEKRATEERERKLWRAGSAVITSAGLNGGISRYLWHNFTGFTMAYIRGPAERISPRGIHICPTETFVIPCLRSACWSSQSSLLVGPHFRRIPPPVPATPYVFVHLVSDSVLEVFSDTSVKVIWIRLVTSASAFREKRMMAYELLVS